MHGARYAGAPGALREGSVSEANLRRRITGLERQLDGAWRLYVVGWMCLAGAAGLFVAGVLVALAGWGIRPWL